MKRQMLANGGWFDVDAATEWSEDQYHDGHNNISVNTGSQWAHESLYRTAKGKYVLCEWSDWQGSVATYTAIPDEQAALWLIKNKEEVPDHLWQFVQSSEV